MIAGLTTVVIPAFNHAEYLAAAIESARAQTAPVEVIVVDDGSTDDTARVLAGIVGTPPVKSELRVLIVPHAGVSQARNRGLAEARGEFVMFLDADDVIAPTKIEEQLAAFSPEIGWVLCDVLIEDETRRVTETASARYRYAQRQLGGWIRGQLAASNFIPVMAPLVRRSVLGDAVRFSDTLEPEDWHFWYAVAAHARVRYVPKVLATYRKRRIGRSRSSALAVAPVDGPVVLNLGCGTPGAPSWHPMPGCVNLDRSMGWVFEDGLAQYTDAAVAAITISHSLMYVHADDWPRVFEEFARVLAPGGVIRITEDDTEHPQSARRGGWRGSEPAVARTSAEIVARALTAVGLRASTVGPDETLFPSRALCQAQHGAAPDVFFVEGTKSAAVFFAPHSDDETLFGAFTIIRERPRVVVCCPSTGDYGTTADRFAETCAATAILGAAGAEQWACALGGLALAMAAFDQRWRPPVAWAPHPRASHPDHVAVSEAARQIFGDRVRFYHTYEETGKVRSGTLVDFAPAWVGQKLRALACYATQIGHPRAHKFFTQDLQEYGGGGQ